MNELSGWAIYGWVALPTVMYGGYALLAPFTKQDELTDFRRTWFRAGHAHAGVLLLMFLLFIDFIIRTDLSNTVKHIASGIFVLGVLTQSGGFFVHMQKGKPNEPSVGTRITSAGAVLLTIAISILVYGIVTIGQ
jgi:hypothetical protein